uniref:Uncharacterized protein n=1 Tax=Eptatretus burgeri TaxID=7764 RepID=A0A8C4N7W2_EPTBU
MEMLFVVLPPYFPPSTSLHPSLELSASVRCDVPVAFWRRLLNELLNVYRWQECLVLLRGGGNGRQVRKGGLASCVNLENLDIGEVVEQMLQGSVKIPMVKLVKALLEQGSVSKGAEHLKHCMEKGEYALASLLLEHGADNDGLVLNPGDTPPHVALSLALGKRDDCGIHMLKFLLQEHCNVNIQDKNGNTLLHLFFQFPLCRLHLDAIKVLSDYPIDLSLRNYEGRDAFWGVKENDSRKKMWKSVAPKQFLKKKTKKKQDVATPPRGSANARGELTTHSSLAEPQPNCDPESDQVGKVTEMPLTKNVSFKQALVTDIKNLILDIDPAMIQAMRAMRQDSMQKSVGISPQSPSEAETFQQFQLSAAQASSDLSEEDNDELVNGEANLANSFGSEDYDDFDRLTWEIECTRDVLRTLNDKLLPPETKNKILRIIHFLGSGDWSKHRYKRVKGIADKSDIKLYEAKIDKAQRILWEIAVDFSPRLSDVPEKIIEAEESSTGDQKVGKVYSEIIRIWDIALAHKDINHIIKKIVSSYNRGIGCMLRRKLKGIDRVKFSSVNAVQQRFPLCYIESNDASQTNVEKAPEYIPPASSIENEYNIMKFHTFSTAVALNILQSHETGSHVEYPFRVGELEHAVINLNPKPAEAIILVGRSGTGKTTCLVYRLWKVFLSYWERAMQAGDPWICKPVSSMRVSSLEDAQAHEENVIMEQGGSEQEVPCSSKHLQNDDCETNAVASEDSCEAVEMYEHLHQLFITKNHVLCNEVKRNFTELFKSSGLSCQFTPLDANVHRLQEIKDENFPLFLTSRQFLLLLDASLPQPFFPRNEDGSLKKTIKGLLVEESDIILDDEDLDDPEFDESSMEFVKEDKKEDSRKLVTYETFTCDIWPAMIKGKQMCNPSLVWMEIKSFLKGSVEATEQPAGLFEPCRIQRNGPEEGTELQWRSR